MTRDELRQVANDKGPTILLVATFVLTIIIVVIALALVPPILTSSNNTTTAKRTDDLAACMSQVAAAYQTSVVALDNARGDLDEITNRGLELTLRGDNVAALEVAAEAPAARARVAAARADRDAAVAVYVDAAKQRDEDPSGFLRDCEAKP